MYEAVYSPNQPLREDVDAWTGAAVLEFGTNWCGYCRNAQPIIREVLEGEPQLRHVKVEDGPGLKLGRSYRIKLWPTLVFLKDGAEVGRVVRPVDAQEIREAVGSLTGG